MPTPTLVQTGAINRQTSGTNNAPSITGVTAGNTLIAVFWGGTSVSGPTDSSGQTWTIIGDTIDGIAGCSAIAYLLNANAGTHNLTFTNSGGASESNITEWTGITAAGSAAVINNNGGTPATGITTGSYTPSQANEIIFAIGGEGGNTNPDNIQCTTAGFQSLGSQSDAGSHSCIMVNQDGNTYNASEGNAQIVTSTSAVTCSWTWTPSLVCSCTIAGFKYSLGDTFTNQICM